MTAFIWFTCVLLLLDAATKMQILVTQDFQRKPALVAMDAIFNIAWAGWGLYLLLEAK